MSGLRSFADRLGLGAWRLFRTNINVLVILGLRGAAVIAGLAVSFLLGRTFGAAATGQFALMSQTAIFLAVFGLLGLNHAVVRHFSKAVAEDKSISLRLFAMVGFIGLGLLMLVAAVLLFGGKLPWAALFGDAVPQGWVWLLCGLILLRGGALMLDGLLRSQQNFVVSQACTVIAIPLVTALALASGLATSVEEALLAGLIGGVAGLAVGGLLLMRHVDTAPSALDLPIRQILASSLPLWGIGLSQNIGDWYALAMAGRMLSPADAGIYRVAFQAVMVLQIVAMAVFSVYSAKISAAFHAADAGQAARLARTATLLSSALGIPAAAVIFLGAEPILLLIGPEFVAAAPIVGILLVGQLAATLTGPCGIVLAMSGNERTNLIVTVAGMGLLLVLVPVGGALAGLEGIAASVAVVLLVRNLTAYLIVRSRLGIGIWSGTYSPRTAGNR